MKHDPSQAVDKARDKLLTQVYKATDAVVAEMDRRFTAAISADNWDWPRGQSPRDIVDTGALRASQQYTKHSDGTYRFSWNVPYAAQVHEGGTFFDGSEMPGRPWTRRAINQMREDKTVQRIMNTQLKKSSGSLNPSSPGPLPTLGS